MISWKDGTALTDYFRKSLKISENQKDSLLSNPNYTMLTDFSQMLSERCLRHII